VEKKLAEMQECIKKETEVNVKFLTIGFSRDHDAVFLNRIATSGNELGNFFYVDISQPDYKEQI
jgi:hypothetical protein